MYRWLLIGIGIVAVFLFTNWQMISNTSSQDVSQILRVPQDFPTIQAAVDKAAEGSTILIGPGIYTENITIAKSLILRGIGLNQTFLQGRVGFKDNDGFSPIISVASRNTKSIILQVSNLTIQNAVIQDSNSIKNVGIRILESQETSVMLTQVKSTQLWAALVAPSLVSLLVENSTFEHNRHAFHCGDERCSMRASDVTVARSRFVKNTVTAVEIESAKIKVYDNTIIGNLDRYGLDESYSAITLMPTKKGRAEVIGNTVSFYIYGISLGRPEGFNFGFDAEIIIKNNYLVANSSGIAISTPYHPDKFKELPSLDVVIEENVIVNGGLGIDLDHRSNSGGGKILLLRNYIAGMKKKPITSNPTFHWGEYPLYGKGVHVRAARSEVRPPVQWIIEMIENKIEKNETWGLTVNQVPVRGRPEGECLIVHEDLLPPGFITGRDNYFSDNGKGALCHPDYPWPPGFTPK